MVHAKLNGQTIEKRKSVDSSTIGEPTGPVVNHMHVNSNNFNSGGGVVTIKKGGRVPSRKLEPIAAPQQESPTKVATKVSPFLAGENASIAISNMSLGLPVAARPAANHNHH